MRCGSCDRDVFGPHTECRGDLARPDDQVVLVKVFETNDPVLLPLVGAVLDDAEIEFMTSGEALQNLVGWSPVLSGSVNPFTGRRIIKPVEFLVRQGDAERAAELMRSLDSSEFVLDDGDDVSDPDP